MNDRYAPIALFVYSRLWHTRQTVEALQGNLLAPQSDLVIFSDSAKKIEDQSAVNEVREYIRDIRGFKSVTIVERDKNFGLAASIIDGVTDLCNKRDRVIVLEDDLVTSPYFLKYMNDALDLYENTEQVMHISGCRYPVGNIGRESTFFFRVPLCWGWATWKRAWKHFEKDISVMDKFNDEMIEMFSLRGSYHYWKQLEMNKSGEIDTWFVFWYATVFLKNGLALFPQTSFVNNIGMDGTGVNCGTSNSYFVEISSFPVDLKEIPIKESGQAIRRHIYFFKKNYKQKNSKLEKMVKSFMGLCKVLVRGHRYI